VIRIVIGVAMIVAVLTIGFTLWFQTRQLTPPTSSDAVEAPRQYDTTGGQEMRPRWDSGGGQANDAPGN